jgi:hypothetical protein
MISFKMNVLVDPRDKSLCHQRKAGSGLPLCNHSLNYLSSRPYSPTCFDTSCALRVPIGHSNMGIDTWTLQLYRKMKQFF